MNIKITIVLFLVSCAFVLPAYAQVGINTSSPDSLSILDLGNSTKGLLIPRLSTSDRLSLGTKSGSGQNSLMVFDTDVNAFFILLDNTWYSLNGWDTPVESNPDMNMTLDMDLMVKVGIDDDPTASEILAVGGDSRIEGKLVSEGVNNNGDLNVTGNIIASGGIAITNEDSAFVTPEYSSRSVTGISGPVLRGSIVMWNGEIINFDSNGLGINNMEGWALCNGSNGTPDLRDRFVVGTDSSVSDESVGDTGGENTHTLTIDEMASHIHEQDYDGRHRHKLAGKGAVRYDSDGSTNKTGGDGDSGSMHGTSSALIDMSLEKTGGDQAHENRPPYYALYFIMKL